MTLLCSGVRIAIATLAHARDATTGYAGRAPWSITFARIALMRLRNGGVDAQSGQRAPPCALPLLKCGRRLSKMPSAR